MLQLWTGFGARTFLTILNWFSLKTRKKRSAWRLHEWLFGDTGHIQLYSPCKYRRASGCDQFSQFLVVFHSKPGKLVFLEITRVVFDEEYGVAEERWICRETKAGEWKANLENYQGVEEYNGGNV
mmetsp:Transcript_32284/g.51526  ORF Transcript_32284/g.51526 Transcript_32284/m.51526 type:complete len:125 (-) Transcript_32284:2506-2880(-)